jgi:DNA-binding NtrC family response regulator
LTAPDPLDERAKDTGVMDKVNFPAAANNFASGGFCEYEKATLMKRRILFVDDEEGIRLVFTEALQEAGYEVETADSASEALRLAHEQNFDLALLDLGLGDAANLDLLHLIHTSLPEMPIIVLTGVAFTKQQAEEMCSAGAMDVLSKMNSLEVILQKLERFFKFG